MSYGNINRRSKAQMACGKKGHKLNCTMATCVNMVATNHVGFHGQRRLTRCQSSHFTTSLGLRLHSASLKLHVMTTPTTYFSNSNKFTNPNTSLLPQYKAIRISKDPLIKLLRECSHVSVAMYYIYYGRGVRRVQQYGTWCIPTPTPCR